MKIHVYSRGSTVIDADGQYQEPMIREAIDQRGDVGSAIVDYTDTERSDISHDDYAIVTGDDGLVLWQGWLTGDPEAAPPTEVAAIPEADLLAMVAYAAHSGFTADMAAEAAESWRTAYEPERAEWRALTAALAAGAEAGQ